VPSERRTGVLRSFHKADVSRKLEIIERLGS
jgi:hypothetical protein